MKFTFPWKRKELDEAKKQALVLEIMLSRESVPPGKDRERRQSIAKMFCTFPENTKKNILSSLKMDEDNGSIILDTLSFEISRVEGFFHENALEIVETKTEYNNILNQVEKYYNGGFDETLRLLTFAYGKKFADDMLTRLTSSLQLKPFEFVKKIKPFILYEFLKNELLQTTALVISFLEPENGKELLYLFPKDHQKKILELVTSIGKVTPEVIREVERVIERKISAMGSDSFTVNGPDIAKNLKMVEVG